jgi:uncharacterized protein (TIGR03435 family)
MRTATLLLAVLSTAPLAAQTPEFDVASVHLGTPESLRHYPRIETLHGKLTTYSMPLLDCIQWAYQVQAAQISGPDWLKDIRLDIVAKAPGPASEQQMYLMLRTLLAARLGVKTHTERKEMPVYVLTVAKGGPKFTKSAGDGPRTTAMDKGVQVLGHVSMYELAMEFSNTLGQPVVNATGLTGYYDLRLDVRPMTENMLDGMDRPSAFLLELPLQFGLKADSRKDWADILVVDHAEKTPKEN